MFCTPILQKVPDTANKLKAIVKYGIGIDAIDIPAAKEKGITVVNIPEYAEETVAEGAFAILIALAKKLPSIQHQMNTKEWAWPSQKWLGVDIAKKTGTSMARMAEAGFKAKFIGYDPNKSKEELAENGIEKYDDLKKMIPQCDFITLHSDLNNEIKHIIGKDQLAVMKETAFIINSAHGALIDELALLDALENKQIVGAGIDIFNIEPGNQSNHPLKRLYQMENVILFPHLTFYTKEAMERLEIETLEKIIEVIENKRLIIISKDPRLQDQYV